MYGDQSGLWARCGLGANVGEFVNPSRGQSATNICKSTFTPKSTPNPNLRQQRRPMHPRRIPLLYIPGNERVRWVILRHEAGRSRHRVVRDLAHHVYRAIHQRERLQRRTVRRERERHPMGVEEVRRRVVGQVGLEKLWLLRRHRRTGQNKISLEREQRAGRCVPVLCAEIPAEVAQRMEAPEARSVLPRRVQPCREFVLVLASVLASDDREGDESGVLVRDLLQDDALGLCEAFKHEHL